LKKLKMALPFVTAVNLCRYPVDVMMNVRRYLLPPGSFVVYQEPTPLNEVFAAFPT
jgi:hypothetical protein